MIEEWFVIPIDEEEKLRAYLTGHPGYKFKQTDIDKDRYINSIPTLHNAKKGDVTCQLTEGNDDQQGNLLVMFAFEVGTFDEGLLGLMRQEFTVSKSSCY
ncbi:hypothetical protein ACP3A9_000137 [Citrobacter amalonaticus]